MQRLFFVAVLAAATLSGCALGPNYQRPKPAIPASFSQNLAQLESGEAANLAKWW